MTPPSRRNRTLRRIAIPLAAATLATGLAAATATPAAASGTYNGHAYVGGTGTFSDDFNDEGVLNTTTNHLSSAVCFWQTLLYADGNLPASGIDGSFGPQTAAATMDWQRKHGLDDDGSVGKLTFKEAMSRFYNWHYISSANHGLYWTGQIRNPLNASLNIYRPLNGGAWTFDSSALLGHGEILMDYNHNLC